MSRKRSLMPDAYRTRKRVCTSAHNSDGSHQSESLENDEWDNHDNHSESSLFFFLISPLILHSDCDVSISIPDHNSNLPNDTKAALLYLKNLFPMEKFEGRLPPIILKHQIYGIIKNRTLVDKEVVSMIPCLMITWMCINFFNLLFAVILIYHYSVKFSKHLGNELELQFFSHKY